MNELKPCPFCGSPAIILYENGDNFKIIGCSNRNNPRTNMLCPNPSFTTYKNDKGGWNYEWWNRRATFPAERQIERIRAALSEAKIELALHARFDSNEGIRESAAKVIGQIDAALKDVEGGGE